METLCGTTPVSSRQACQTLGFNTGLSESPITAGDRRRRALAMRGCRIACSRRASLRKGIALPDGGEKTRPGYGRLLQLPTREELQFALDAFAKVGRELRIIG